MARCADKIRKRCLKDVIPRFQRVGTNMEVAFFWYLSKKYGDKSGSEQIYSDDGMLVNLEAVAFLRKNFAPLCDMVYREWDKFYYSKSRKFYR